MATADEPRRYTFGPLERRGLVMGFQASQLAVAGTACLIAVAIMRVDPTATGAVVGAGVVAGAVAAACCSVSGRPAASWAPVAAAWAWRRLSRTRTSPQPGYGHRPGAAAGAPGGRSATAPSSGGPLPGLSRLEVTVHGASAGQPQLAVVRDRRAGTYAAVVAVRARSFSLLDPDDKQQRLAAWGAALAALAREGSPVHRLQWVERALPGDTDELLDHLGRAGRGDGPGRRSYADLVAGAGPTIRQHEVLLVLAVRARGGTGRRLGSGRDGPLAMIRRELHLLGGQLDAADLIVDRVFDEADLAAALEVAVDPDTPTRRAARHRWLPQSWPLASDEGWGAYHTDGAWHATYWVAEWPRLDVGPDFLSPMLLSPGVRRTVAVTMAPVGPARAARQVEAARTADLADDELRRRAGFLTTARRQREAEGVVRRSAELADGHAEYRFAGYVTVSAPDRVALDTACAEVEQCASQSHLELRRLYGQQEDAFTWTLPLARGLS